MTETKHTPGSIGYGHPRHTPDAVAGLAGIMRESNYYIQQQYPHGLDPSTASVIDRQAGMRLGEAALDLLAALQGITDRYYELLASGDLGQCYEDENEDIIAAKAAIVKATGEGSQMDYIDPMKEAKDEVEDRMVDDAVAKRQRDHKAEILRAQYEEAVANHTARVSDLEALTREHRNGAMVDDVRWDAYWSACETARIRCTELRSALDAVMGYE